MAIHHSLFLPVRPRRLLIRRSEQGDERRPKSRSDVHRAAVVRHEDVAIFDQARQLPQTRDASQVHHPLGQPLADLLHQLFARGISEKDDVELLFRRQEI